MKVATTSDWRDGIPFDTPVVVADVVPGDPTRCSVCGSDSQLRDRSELWAVKHRHPHHHNGFVRFYCNAHVPLAQPAAVRAQQPAARAARRAPAPRRPAAADTVRAMCPDCFIEVSASGMCGNCGQQVA